MITHIRVKRGRSWAKGKLLEKVILIEPPVNSEWVHEFTEE